MIYDFQCQGCEEIFEVESDVEKRDDPVVCQCGASATRIFSPTVHINPGAAAFVPDRYHAFGKVFSTRDQLRQEISRIQGETGKEIVELGNDKPPSSKPIYTKINKDAACRDMYQALRRIKRG